MSIVLTGRRVVFAVLSVFAAIAIYLAFPKDPQKAQELPVEPAKARFDQFAISDAITADIRSNSREIVRVNINSLEDRNTVTKYGRIVEDYGSFLVLAKNKRTNLKKSGLETQTVETSINLPGAKFDPIASPPTETVRPGSEPGSVGRGYYVVQFGGIAKDDWLDSVRDAGVEILQYVPHQAFFVYGDGQAIAKVAGHSRVRWVGGYAPEQKQSAELADFARNAIGETAMFDVAVFSRADLLEVAAKFRKSVNGRIIGQSKLPSNFFNILRVEMPVGEIAKAAAMFEVFRIDPYVRPVGEDERAAHIVAGNFTSPTVLSPPGYNPLTQFGANGTGVTVAVSDYGVSIPGNGGFYLTAANTVDGPLRGATTEAEGGHGHLSASIIAGGTPFGVLDPMGYNYGQGIAPKANIVNIPFLKSGNTTTDAQGVDDSLNTLGPNGVRATISNNSWGAGANGSSYDSYAAQYDGLVRDGSLAATIDPFSVVFSAGNSGPGASTMTRPKVAKNVISVGNAESIRTELGFSNADNIDDLRNSSSRGPAADGRVKPDIIAPGSYITGSRPTDCYGVTGCIDDNHAYSSGTSHAAPQISGAAALFTQYWRDANSGAYPSPALIKASIISSAQEMNGLNTSTPIPNGNEGWGRINMKRMMNTGVAMKYVNQEIEFSDPGVGQGFLGRVADSTKPIRVSLVWTDPPGVGNPALVNNLDLVVNVGGTVYKGNVFTGGVSTSGGTADSINNVENVFLPAGIPAGTFFSVFVSSAAINGDGILGNADTTDQHFALVAYNFASPVTNVKSPFDFDGDQKTDISIFRPSAGEWWYNRSSDGQTRASQFGNGSDRIVPADYTGDGKADIAFWRPTTGEWFILRSEDSTFLAFPFGTVGDVPAPGDFDGDSKADAAVFRTSNSTWFILRSGGGVTIQPFGTSGDVPAVADYDGDAKADIAIYRPNGTSGGEWWIQRSTAGLTAFQFGASTDKIVQGDYTGDGKADAAFWRPSTGFWFILRSEDFSFFAFPFGTTSDVPVPGDYDGDGKFDAGVFRPSGATWFVNRSTAGILIASYGLSTDTPLPNAYVR